MVARAIRIGLALLAVLWAALSECLRAGHVPLAPLVAALVIFVGYIGSTFGASLVSRRHSSPVPPERRATWEAILPGLRGEALGRIMTYFVLVPFEQAWLGADDLGPLPPGRLPVLLVHGYGCNRGIWWWLRRHLRRDGIPVATISLEPPFASIDRFAVQLHERIEALVAETGAPQVVLVGHSMGGLVARAYLRLYGADRVTRMVTLGVPHHGTRTAPLGPGANAREMRPGSDFLARLEEPAPVPVINLWTAWDSIVLPQESSRLDGAEEIVLPATGHNALLFSPAVLAAIRRASEVDPPQ